MKGQEGENARGILRLVKLGVDAKMEGAEKQEPNLGFRAM